jgi:hypothetical protein
MLEITGWSDTLWLTKQERRDHDEAVFGEFTYDFTDKLTGTAGLPPLQGAQQPGRLLRLRPRLRRHAAAAGTGGFPGRRDRPRTTLKRSTAYNLKVIKAYGEAKCELLYGADSDDLGALQRRALRELQQGGQGGRHAATAPT